VSPATTLWAWNPAHGAPSSARPKVNGTVTRKSFCGNPLGLSAQIPYRPAVILFSEKDLHLDGAEIRQTACATPPGSESAYHFRYDGLVLLIDIGNQYVLLPRTWQRGHGTAIVLPSSGIGATRFEFSTTNDFRPAPTC
jgi:hypothetical protein